MTKFDNVKLIIQDINNNYLVGRRYNKKFKYSSLGGHREKNETILQTMSRELNEETSGLLKILVEGKKYYISDKKHKYPIEISDIVKDGNQIYILIYIPFDLNEYINRWKHQFHNNQETLVFDEVESLYSRYPSISVLQWFEYLLKFKILSERKSNTANSELEKILESRELTKKDIGKILKELEEIGYYLEMDDLELVTLDRLKMEDGLYERDFVNML